MFNMGDVQQLLLTRDIEMAARLKAMDDKISANSGAFLKAVIVAEIQALREARKDRKRAKRAKHSAEEEKLNELSVIDVTSDFSVSSPDVSSCDVSSCDVSSSNVSSSNVSSCDVSSSNVSSSNVSIPTVSYEELQLVTRRIKAIEFEVQELTDVILFSNSSSSKRKGKAQTKAERIRGKCCIVGCKGTWVPEHGSRKETCSPECANQMKLLNLAIRRGNKNSIMMNNKSFFDFELE